MLALGFLISAHAARLVVDGDGGGDHTTIQDAVDAASRGDHIVVLAGTYEMVSLNSVSVPIIGLDGPDAVWIDTSDFWAIYHTDSERLRLEGLSLVAADSAVYSSGGGVHARRVRTYDSTYGFYGYYSDPWLLQAVVAGGHSMYGITAYHCDMEIEHATFVANSAHLYSRNMTVTAAQVVGYDGVPVHSCSSSTMDVSYALFGDISGTWPSCASSSSVMLGFDVEFNDYAEGGDWEDQDLREVGLGVDAGPSGCEDVDGSVCDLGAFGGPWGSDTDHDRDGLPDAWEEEQGLDPTVDDGADDEDGDGLDNLAEYLYDTDLADADTDGDGADDLDELQAGFDPLDPDDQAPTAVLAGASWAYVDEPSLLDGRASSDPLGEALSHRWTATRQPSASTMDSELGDTATLTFVPDAAGAWTIQLEVDDGTTTDTASLEIAVYEGREVRIPEDFASFAEIDPQPGMVVVFGAGEHVVEGLTVEDELTLRGAGADETTLVVDRLTSSNGGLMRLQDLRVTGSTNIPPVYTYGGRLELSAVTVDTPDSPRGIAVLYGILTAHDLTVTAQDDGIFGTAALLDVRRGSIAAATAVNNDNGTTRLEGLFLEATLYGVEGVGGSFELHHLTVAGATLGLRVSGSTVTGDHLYFHEVGSALACYSGAESLYDFVLTSDSGLGGACTVLRSQEDTSGPDEDGVPSPESLAWDGGDWRLLDPDGTVTDIGVSGGAFGLRQEHELAAPNEDLDGDGLTAVIEWMLGSSDEEIDSDGDGHTDIAEHTLGGDPADPANHHPDLDGLLERAAVGGTLEVAPSWNDDPDGDSCTFTWEDGSEAIPRTFDTSVAGVQTLAWTLVCGAGASAGEAVVIVTEDLFVPSDFATVTDALAAAEDHHRIVLEVGEHVGDADLRGRSTALVGEGRDSRLVGDVLGDQAALQVQDLLVEGDVRVDGGSLSRLEVIGALWTGSAGGRYVLVHDDLHVLEGASFRDLTVMGDLVADTVGLGAAAVAGELRTNEDAILSYTHAGTALGQRPFILYDTDPEVAILEPWPGSNLWDNASTAVEDPDGSVEDIGYTGGPGAWETDADLDGMNDRWEDLYDVDDPAADIDGDGLVNVEEFALGTEPNNPDTDGDRVPDGEDPDPLISDGGSVRVRLDIDDRHPWPGQIVTLSATGSYDPLGSELAFSWTIEGPPGSELIEFEGPVAVVAAEGAGAWDVRLSVETDDGLEFELIDDFHTRRAVPVPKGADLQAAIDEALPGSMLVLQEGGWSTNLVVSDDLVLTHAEGAHGGVIEGLVDGPAIMVTGGHLLLEDISVRGAGGTATLQVTGGDLQLRRARLFAGDIALLLQDGDVDAANSVIIGASQLVSAYQSRVSFRHCVLGYPEDLETLEPPMSLADTHLRVENSVFVWTAPHINAISCSFRCTADFYASIVPDPSFLQVGGVVTSADLIDEDPGFLLRPDEAERQGLGDYRLAGSSPAIDAGKGGVDPDGSVADIGVHGGRYGDWPDVDEDRDGYTNLENDCDDTDRTVVPDLWTGTCPAPQGCTGCGGGATPRLLGLLAALLLTRRKPSG